MARSWEETSPELWVKAVQGLPPEPLKFALNASLNTLPTNANLHMWGKKTRDNCILCQEHRQSLLNILNTCQVAMGLRRYSERHDSVLKTSSRHLYHLTTQSLSTSPHGTTASPTTSLQLI